MKILNEDLAVYNEEEMTLTFTEIDSHEHIVINDELENRKSAYELAFNNCSFHILEISENIQFLFLTIDNCQIGEIRIRTGKAECKIQIEGSETRIQLIDAYGSENSEIIFFGGSYDYVHLDEPIKELQISGGLFNEIRISDIMNPLNRTNPESQFRKILIAGQTFSDSPDEPIEIRSIQILSDNILDLSFERLIVDSLFLKGVIGGNSNYRMDNLQVNEFKIVELKNKGSLVISNVRSKDPNSTIQITGVDFGNTQFREFDFDSFDNIGLKSSDLSSLRLYSSTIPWNLEGDPKNLYEMYNDLYTSAGNRNNAEDKMNYYRATQDNLLKVKRTERKSWERLGSIWALGFSKWFSDFGTNWLKALLIILIISILIYVIVLSTLSNSVFDISSQAVFNTISRFFMFINPIRGNEFVETLGAFTWVTIIVDFIYRIFIGVGIFELIRSFRKYVRK